MLLVLVVVESMILMTCHVIVEADRASEISLSLSLSLLLFPILRRFSSMFAPRSKITKHTLTHTGGIKSSGYGRFNGLEGIRQYTYLKSMTVPLGGAGKIPWRH